MTRALLRELEDVKWTSISPAADFQAKGARTGAYTLAGEELTLNSSEEPTISYADYAINDTDEIEAASTSASTSRLSACDPRETVVPTILPR